MVLERELEHYESRKEELIKAHAGKFVLIKDDLLEGVFDSSEAAYKAGLARFGNTPFLIKQVLTEEPIGGIPALELGLLYARS